MNQRKEFPADFIAIYGSIKAAADALGANYHTFYAWHRKNKFPAKVAKQIAATPTGSPSLSTESGAGVAATE